MEKQNSEKNIGLSCLRIIATLAVLWLHTAGTVGEANPSLQPDVRSVLLFYQIIMNWAVPVFFMITGALMLNPEKEITAGQCIKKYAFRMLKALFLFGIPFSLMILVFESKSFAPAMIIDSFFSIFTGKSFAHLWYLYVLVGLYLILPVLRGFIKNASENDIRIILSVLFLFNLILPTISGYTSFNFEFSVPFTYPVFYLFLGYYLCAFKPKIMCHRWINAIILVLFCLCIYIFMCNEVPLNCFGYNGIFTGVVSASIFSLFVCHSKTGSSHKYDIIWKIDRLCFGVYLIHPVFIQFSYRFLKLTPASFDMYYISIIPFFIVFTICSFFASWVMSLIKPLKKYIL